MLVVAGAPQREGTGVSLEEGVALVRRKKEDGLRMKEAVRQVAEDTGLPRNALYDAVLQSD